LTDVLYFNPGYAAPNWLAEIWKYNGTDAPTKVWDGPTEVDHYWQITCLHYLASTGKVLIFMSEYDWEINRVYAFDPSLGTAIKVVDDYSPHVDYYDPARQVAEFGGLLYVQHGGISGVSVLCSIDPSDWSLTTIQAADGAGESDDGAGGVAVGTDDNIYWCSGPKVWSSATGAAESFSEIYDIRGAYAAAPEAAGLFLHSDGNVYFGGRYATTSSQWYQRVHQVSDNTVTVDRDYDLTTQSNRQLVVFGSLSDGLAALEWAVDGSGDWHSIFDDGGGWDADLANTNRTTLTPGCGVYGGKLYYGLTESGTYNTELWRRDSAGNATRVQRFDNYLVFPSYQGDMPMAVGPDISSGSTSRVFFIRTGR
jgi:hypothetical protein